MPLELIKEVNGVPQVEPLTKLQKVHFRSLQPGCDYSGKYVQVRLFITQNSYLLLLADCQVLACGFSLNFSCLLVTELLRSVSHCLCVCFNQGNYRLLFLGIFFSYYSFFLTDINHMYIYLYVRLLAIVLQVSEVLFLFLQYCSFFSGGRF